MLDPPGPPVIHSASGAESAGASFSLAKYQKKKCLWPTSSQPVYWSTGVSQSVAFCRLIRMECWGETVL